MRTNIKHFARPVPFKKLSDGSVMSLPVDQFPVSDVSLYKRNGFPASDIILLDRFSREHHSKEEIELIASRLEEIKEQPRNKMSDAELLRVLKPSWAQTSSEMAQYEESVYQYLASKKESEKAVVQPDQDVSVPVESVQKSD